MNRKPDNQTLKELLNYFAAVSFDRMGLIRNSDGWLTEQLAKPSTRIVPMWQDMNLILMRDDPSSPPEAVFPTYEEFHALYPGITPRILLGCFHEGGEVYFVVELDASDESVPSRFESLGRFVNLRVVCPFIDSEHAALLGYARAMIYWHRHHRFCGTCGSPTRNAQCGHVRLCLDERCKRQHFPRTDPAVIVLISGRDNEKCLLGRSPKWPEHRFSTLAGFVEPGESLEQAVSREVFEESGVRIDSSEVIYHSSQPWPFPASIMLGFTAVTDYQDIRIDPNELVEARWFSREDIENGLKDKTFILPSTYSIAHRLIREWMES